MAEDPLEARLRRELHQAADQIEPQGTLADLRRRIKIWRLFHRRPRRLVKAARSEPEPSTELLSPVDPDRRGGRSDAPPPAAPSTPVGRQQGPAHRHHPQAPPHRCRCGRPTWRPFCCWTCMVAKDGGWLLLPWSPMAPWTDVHTWTCEERSARYDPVGTQPPPPQPWRPDGPPMPSPAVPAPAPRAHPDVRPALADVPGRPPAGSEGGLLRPLLSGQPQAGGSPAGSHPGR